MDFISDLLDFLNNFDFIKLIHTMGPFTYLILFVIIFGETGFVVLPFLPGDSILFLAGMIAASTGKMNVFIIFFVTFIAAVLGNITNYYIGYLFGAKILTHSKIIKQKHLEKTHKVFEKYGIQAIIVSRFVPIVRTIAPFVAGIGKMSRKKFHIYNLIGGFLWTFILVFSGYFLSIIPWVKANPKFIILIILVVSLLPVVFEGVRHKFFSPKK